MRLVQKLSLAIVFATSTIIAVGGAVRAQREVGYLETDRLHDHYVLGRALGAAVSAMWRADGADKALAVVAQASRPGGRLRMRWVWLDSTGDQAPAIAPAELLAVAAGDPLTRVVTREGKPMRYTYVPLTVDKTRHGALELSESLSGEKRFTTRVITETLVTTMVVALVVAGVSLLLGVWIIGRPVEALAHKARRVGLGDFSGPLLLPQKDELGQLAKEMNTMCERLVLAHEQVAGETAKTMAALEQLRHADRLNTVGKLASGIAHELGTPLNVVSARAQMIAAGETTPEETADYANVIVQSTDKMTRIIRQLLDFARRRSAAKTAVSLAALARSTISLLTPLAAKRSVTLTFEGDDAVRVMADPSALDQVVTNLVVNGTQSMDKPGTVRVAVSSEVREPPPFVGGAARPYAVLRVSDEGHGIAEADLPHVFEPFFTTKDVGEGTGLGLSVAYGIVQDHGGWIEAESKPGAGACFTVVLPLELT